MTHQGQPQGPQQLLSGDRSCLVRGRSARWFWGRRGGRGFERRGGDAGVERVGDSGVAQGVSTRHARALGLVGPISRCRSVRIERGVALRHEALRYGARNDDCGEHGPAPFPARTPRWQAVKRQRRRSGRTRLLSARNRRLWPGEVASRVGNAAEHVLHQLTASGRETCRPPS